MAIHASTFSLPEIGQASATENKWPFSREFNFLLERNDKFMTAFNRELSTRRPSCFQAYSKADVAEIKVELPNNVDPGLFLSNEVKEE